MRVIEIQQLKKNSPTLRGLLQALRLTPLQRDCYRFLREQVRRWDTYSDDDTCSHCGRAIYPKWIHPFDAPEQCWCIDCILGAYCSDTPLYQEPVHPYENAWPDCIVIRDWSDAGPSSPDVEWG